MTTKVISLLHPQKTVKYAILNKEKKIQRLAAKESSTTIINKSSRILLKKFKNFNNLPKNHQATFKNDGNDYLLEASPITIREGINWLIVLTVPIDDFISKIM